MLDEGGAIGRCGFHDVYIYHRAESGASTSAKLAIKSLAYISNISYRPEKQRTRRLNPLPVSWRPTALGFPC